MGKDVVAWRRRTGVWCLAILVGLMAAFLSSGWLKSDSTDSQSERGSAAVLEAQGDCIATASMSLNAIAEGFGLRSPPRTADDLEATAPPHGKEDSTWWPGVVRHRHSLAFMFMHGGIKPNHVWRHELLNLEDRPPCKEDKDDLKRLLAQINRAIAPVLRHKAEVECAERIAAVKGGRVREHIQPPMDLRQLENMARMMANEAEKQGEAVVYEEILAQLQAAPPSNTPNTSYFSHEGKFYLLTEFPDLPQSREVQRGVRFCVSEAFMLLYAFFASRGYTAWTSELEEVVRELTQ